MDLASHQRRLLALLRSGYEARANDEPYIRRVGESKDLQEARRNIFLWRVYVLERTATLTFSLLKQRNLLGEAVSDFIARCNISPFRETQAPAFLEGLSDHHDRLVALVAQFELALFKVRHGDLSIYSIIWNVDPRGVLYALARGVGVADRIEEGAYQINVSSGLQREFEIVPLNGDHGTPVAVPSTGRAAVFGGHAASSALSAATNAIGWSIIT
jgi:hypothetical protein